MTSELPVQWQGDPPPSTSLWTVSERPSGTRPFLRWPGGKRWLVPHLCQLLHGMSFQRYLEPFLGGGSVFLGLAPRTAQLRDVNAELITTYSQVRFRPKRLKDALRVIPVDASTYSNLRSHCPTSGLDTAVRLLYLNRTAFGGIYRLSQAGSFNVPFGRGRTPATLYASTLLEEAGRLLRRATLSVGDFSGLLTGATTGDLVYCDPSYSVTHNSNGFVRYNEAVFKWVDQERLADSARQAARRGAVVLVSNADHPDLSALYPEALRLVFHRQSRLCPNATYRRTTSEALFILGPDSLVATVRGRCHPEAARQAHGVTGLLSPSTPILGSM